MRKTVYCIASTESQANEILTQLRNLGFPAADISVILPNKGDTKNIGVREDAIRGAEAGGLVGGILGWLAGLSTLILPGVGTFLAVGPLVSAFGAAAAGGVVGGLIGGSGAVHPLGESKEVNARIEEHLRHGEILISVHTDDPAAYQRAIKVFKEAGASGIYHHDQAAA